MLQTHPVLALSTCWCSGRHTDGYAMLREMADLGFSHVELSHGIRITLVPGILRALEAGVIKVCSTHNFCPLPTGYTQPAPNAFEPSSLDVTEHEQWARQTKRSLDFARQVGARVLVAHLGSVRFWWRNPMKKVLRYAEDFWGREQGTSAEQVLLANDPRFIAVVEKAFKKLHTRITPYWEQVHASIEQVREYAMDRGISLGFENRERPDELPLEALFDELFSKITQPHTAGYWHDTGHAHIKELMGMAEHKVQLEKNADRLLGFHLHDTTSDGCDHQPLGEGGIDFEMVSRYWKPQHLLVLELSPRVSVEGVKKSKNRIEALMRRGH